jgi:hypothetical protein
MSLGLQWTVVLLALAASCAYLARRQWPHAIDALRRRLTIWLLRPDRAGPLRRLGRRLAPSPRVSLPATGACGGCSDRKACSTHPA